MATAPFHGFDEFNSGRDPKDPSNRLGSDAQPSIESLIGILEKQMITSDSQARYNFVSALLSEKLLHIPIPVVQYCLSRMLHMSAVHSDIPTAELLLAHNINVNEPDPLSEFTPLCAALAEEQPAFIAFLLQNGADPFAKMGEETVIEFMMIDAQPETIKLVLSIRPDICETLLSQPALLDQCIEDGNPANIALLIEMLKEKVIESTINPEALSAFAMEEDASNVKRLQQIGFSFDIFNEASIEAFTLSIKSGNSELASLLIDQGILSIADMSGNLPLHLAIQYERIDILRKILENNVNINQLNNFDECPLILAAKSKNLEIFSMILDHEPNVDDIDLGELIEAMTLRMKIEFPHIIDMHDAQFPSSVTQQGIDYDLHFDIDSIREKNSEECLSILQTLLRSTYVPEECIYGIISNTGLDINASIDRYGTLLHLAARENLVYAIRVLLKLGADINALCDADKSTPLHAAIRATSKEAAMLLIQLGADLEIKDDCEYTPLLEATSKYDNNNRVIIELLRGGADDYGLIYAIDEG